MQSGNNNHAKFTFMSTIISYVNEHRNIRITSEVESPILACVYEAGIGTALTTSSGLPLSTVNHCIVSDVTEHTRPLRLATHRVGTLKANEPLHTL